MKSNELKEMKPKMPKSRRKSVQMSVRFTPREARRVRELAREMGLTNGDWISKIVTQKLVNEFLIKQEAPTTENYRSVRGFFAH